MISGVSQLGKADEAFFFFRQMLSCGVIPSVRCITSLLAACSSLSMQHYGKQIHAYVARMKIADDDFLFTAIIGMYMKCGQFCLAYNLFSQYLVKPSDPAFWNATILGCGKNGKSDAAFDIFNQLVKQKVNPNLVVTFSCIFSVCSHTGEVGKGFEFFRLMTIRYNLHPTWKHTNTLIDLLSRSGMLDKASELLQATGGDNTCDAGFASLLGAFENNSDSKLAAEMTHKLLELETDNPIPFVILSNTYAGQKKWKDVHKIRKSMDKKGLKKLPSLSSITVA